MSDAPPPTDEPAAAPAQSTELAAAYAAGVGASGDNRYAHLMTSDQQKEFRDTFEFFDVDKGGDVDNRELGLMFRQLGLTPSDEEVERMIADFDYDHSGTIDFEEFCGMMLSSVRAARTPAWLTDRFADGVATADLTRAGAQKLLPLDLLLRRASRPWPALNVPRAHIHCGVDKRVALDPALHREEVINIRVL